MGTGTGSGGNYRISGDPSALRDLSGDGPAGMALIHLLNEKNAVDSKTKLDLSNLSSFSHEKIDKPTIIKELKN
jgi:hypothetical protein